VVLGGDEGIDGDWANAKQRTRQRRNLRVWLDMGCGNEKSVGCACWREKIRLGTAFYGVLEELV
jgi:hypothetical protein